MRTRILSTAALCCVVFSATGCGQTNGEKQAERDSSSAQTDREQVERLVKAKSPKQPVQSVACVELEADRQYRCEVSLEGEGYTYKAIVSKDGTVVQLVQQ